jgi:hypothetical protein
MRTIICFDTAALSQTVERVRLHDRGTAAHRRGLLPVCAQRLSRLVSGRAIHEGQPPKPGKSARFHLWHAAVNAILNLQFGLPGVSHIS